VKCSLKAANARQAAHIKIGVELLPDTQKDYEIIPFYPDPAANQAAIAAFMARYVNKPFEYGENVVGVELNFNKVFYKPEKLRGVHEVLAALATLEADLKTLEAGLGL
jgi:type I restriction enzyme M protein